MQATAKEKRNRPQALSATCVAGSGAERLHHNQMHHNQTYVAKEGYDVVPLDVAPLAAGGAALGGAGGAFEDRGAGLHYRRAAPGERGGRFLGMKLGLQKDSVCLQSICVSVQSCSGK